MMDVVHVLCPPQVKSILIELFGGQENADSNDQLIAQQFDKLSANALFK
jgi:hypothetical protein